MTFVGDPSLADIAEVCGEEGAMRLAEKIGGERIYIPSPERLKSDGALVEAVGRDCALKICAALHGSYLQVPCGPARRARIVQLHRQKVGPADIRRRVGCSRSLVFKVLKQEREAAEGPAPIPDQPSLF